MPLRYAISFPLSLRFPAEAKGVQSIRVEFFGSYDLYSRLIVYSVKLFSFPPCSKTTDSNKQH